MGTIGGGVFQSIKGFRNAPSVSTAQFVFSLRKLDQYLGIFRDFQDEHLEV